MDDNTFKLLVLLVCATVIVLVFKIGIDANAHRGVGVKDILDEYRKANGKDEKALAAYLGRLKIKKGGFYGFLIFLTMTMGSIVMAAFNYNPFPKIVEIFERLLAILEGRLAGEGQPESGTQSDLPA